MRALEQGADGIECDLRRLSDGAVILFHDGTVGGAIVEELTRAELEALIGPVFEAAQLEQLPPDTVIDLEVKKSGWEPELMALAARLPKAFVSSFDHDVLSRLLELGWRGPMGALVEEPAHLDLEHPGVAAARYVLPRSPRVSGQEIRRWIDAGYEVIPWTVNDVARARQLIAWGCRGLITDLPGMMSAELRIGSH